MTDMMEQRVYRLLQRIKADGYAGEWLPELDEVLADLVQWPSVTAVDEEAALEEIELRADAERELARDAAQARAEELDGPRD
jgi:hypothetical protein